MIGSRYSASESHVLQRLEEKYNNFKQDLGEALSVGLSSYGNFLCWQQSDFSIIFKWLHKQNPYSFKKSQIQEWIEDFKSKEKKVRHSKGLSKGDKIT